MALEIEYAGSVDGAIGVAGMPPIKHHVLNGAHAWKVVLQAQDAPRCQGGVGEGAATGGLVAKHDCV